MMVDHIVPTNGPLVGVNLVTLIGRYLGNADITHVALVGVPVLSHTWQSSTRIVLQAAAAASSSIGRVVVNSTSFGYVRSNVTYTYNPRTFLVLQFLNVAFLRLHAEPVINKVLPNNGPRVGGVPITIFCQHFGVGDLTSVYFVGHAAASFYWVNATTILAWPSVQRVGGTGHVVVNSTSYGTAVLPDGFTYNPTPVISAITPSIIRNSGGVIVTLRGNFLGNNDVFEATLCGVYATSISWLTSTAVAVVSGPAPSLANCSGTVTMASRLWGNTSFNSITYLDGAPFL